MQGSFRKPEIAAVDKVEVVDPLTVRLLLKEPFSPLIAQLTDRAGMIVSPKAAEEAGDKFGLQAGLRRSVQVRRARAAGPHRASRSSPTTGTRPMSTSTRSSSCRSSTSTVRLANLRSGGLDLIERAARDRHPEIVRDDAKLKLVEPLSSSATRASPSTSAMAKADKAARQGRPRAPGLRAVASIATPSTRSCSTASSCRATSGSARRTPTTRASFPMPKRDVAKAKELLKEAGVTTPVAVDFMVPNNPETAAGRRGDPVDGGGGRLRPEDPRHRVRHLAQGGRGGRLPGLPARLVAAASIPTATPTSSTRLQGAAEQRRLLQPGGRPLARRGARPRADPAERKAIYENSRRRSCSARRARSSTSITAWC